MGQDSRGIAAASVGALLLFPATLHANPIVFDPGSFLAFAVVVFWALLIEAGVVALALAFSGVAPFRFFIGFLLANVSVFLFLFYPLLPRVHVALLEGMVVLVDGASIQLLSRLQPLQGPNFRGVSWGRSWGIAALGNIASFFVGEIASAQPWLSHDAG